MARSSLERLTRTDVNYDPLNDPDLNGLFGQQLIKIYAQIALDRGNDAEAELLLSSSLKEGAVQVVAAGGPIVGAIAGQAIPAIINGAQAAVQKFSGALPVAKGQAGVARAIQDITSQGGTVTQKEVTFENSNGVRSRVDFLYTDSTGQRRAAEVKNGPYAALTTNQAEVYSELATIGAIPRGSNAAKAGLTVGRISAPIPVDIIRYP